MSQQIRNSAVNKLFIIQAINHVLSVLDFMRTVVDKFSAISPMIPLIVINIVKYVPKSQRDDVLGVMYKNYTSY